MFKTKIEVKTKEEMKKENDKWLNEVAKRGFTWESYKEITKKKAAAGEEHLQHGVEKTIDSSKHPKTQQFVLQVKDKVKDYVNKNFNFVTLISFIIILLFVLIRIYSLLLKIDRETTELSQKYNTLIREISLNNIICSK